MTRPPLERLDEIAAYCYRADLYCPGCVIEQMIDAREASPAARDMLPEAAAIDRDDETSYDSGEFPKVVLRGELAADGRCAACHEPL